MVVRGRRRLEYDARVGCDGDPGDEIKGMSKEYMVGRAVECGQRRAEDQCTKCYVQVGVMLALLGSANMMFFAHMVSRGLQDAEYTTTKKAAMDTSAERNQRLVGLGVREEWDAKPRLKFVPIMSPLSQQRVMSEHKEGLVQVAAGTSQETKDGQRKKPGYYGSGKGNLQVVGGRGMDEQGSSLDRVHEHDSSEGVEQMPSPLGMELHEQDEEDSVRQHHTQEEGGSKNREHWRESENDESNHHERPGRTRVQDNAPTTNAASESAHALKAASRFEDVGTKVWRYTARDLPIAVIAYNRPQYLQRCLESLLAAQGVNASFITVLQDGDNAQVAATARRLGVALVQHPRTAGIDGAHSIAQHYGWSLVKLFHLFPSVRYGIMLEDDLIVSADFLRFFITLAPAMDADSSLYCISAYNDNGLAHLSQDVSQVYRTEWFVGLGWLVSRDLFMNQWLPEWPETHWDHWLREDAVRQGRECLFPEVSRDFHIGEMGVNMDSVHYKRYNSHVRLNQDAKAQIRPPSELVREVYEESLHEKMRQGRVVRDLSQLEDPLAEAETGQCDSPMLVYYVPGLSDDQANERGRITASSPWKPISNFFGLWHEPRRGRHQGMHRFHYRGRCVFLIDGGSEYARMHMPTSDFVPFGGQHFGQALWDRISKDPTIAHLLTEK